MLRDKTSRPLVLLSFLLYRANKMGCIGQVPATADTEGSSLNLLLSNNGRPLSSHSNSGFLLLFRNLDTYSLIFLRLLCELVFARVAWCIDIEFLGCYLPAPKVLTNQEDCPIAYDEDQIDREALSPLWSFKDGEDSNRIKAEERPADGHHRLVVCQQIPRALDQWSTYTGGKATRFIIVFHQHVCPREEDRCYARRHAEQIVNED